METRIQYAKTKDGLNISYWVIGEEGPWFIAPPPAHPWSHIELELGIPEWKLWYELLAQRCRVVRFDYRGTGLSDRRLPDSLDDLLADMEAVTDRLEIDDAVVYGCNVAGAVAMSFAARYPDRVSHLLLWCAFAKQSDTAPEVSAPIEMLLESNYEMFTQMLAHTVMGWDEGAPAHNMALYMQQSVDHESLKHFWRLAQATDVSQALPKIKAKTLILQRKDFKLVTPDTARGLASSIPNAHVAFINGDSLAPYLDDVETPMRLTWEFIADHPALRREEEEPEELEAAGEFRTIVFTDMESSTALTRQLGDEKAQELLRAHNGIVREALRAHGGREIKHTGDGIMASFSSATRALEWAVTVQREVADHIEKEPDAPFAVRIGVNAGEPVAEEGDIFGTSVQMAARICDQGNGWEVLVSDVVRQLTAGRGFLFSERDPAALKGFEEPIRIFELRWRETS